MKESGAIYRLRQDYNIAGFKPFIDYIPEDVDAKGRCETHEGKPVGIHKISSVFAIVVIGIGIGFLIYV